MNYIANSYTEATVYELDVTKNLSESLHGGYKVFFLGVSDDGDGHYFLFIKCFKKSMGRGKMIVEFFSAEIVFSVWNRKTGGC